MVDDQPQAAASQLVGRETVGFSAPAAKVSVTGAVGTPTTHGTVVCFHFLYSCVSRQFDTNGKIFLDGGVRLSSKGASLLHFHAHGICPSQEKGAGF